MRQYEPLLGEEVENRLMELHCESASALGRASPIVGRSPQMMRKYGFARALLKQALENKGEGNFEELLSLGMVEHSAEYLCYTLLKEHISYDAQLDLYNLLKESGVEVAVPNLPEGWVRNSG